MATKRKAASELTAAEQTAYHDTIGQLIQTGAYGSMVAIHGDMSHDQHGSMGPTGAERFLPWHRDFLLKLEGQMQTLNPNAFIPYWDWTQAGEESIPITGRPVAWATGMATRPLPIASSTIGPSASRARST